MIFGFYRLFISPALHTLAGPGHGCRFSPTCSEYAQNAIQNKGWIVGTGLALSRLIKCHPWSRQGLDPLEKAS